MCLCFGIGTHYVVQATFELMVTLLAQSSKFWLQAMYYHTWIFLIKKIRMDLYLKQDKYKVNWSCYLYTNLILDYCGNWFYSSSSPRQATAGLGEPLWLMQLQHTDDDVWTQRLTEQAWFPLSALRCHTDLCEPYACQPGLQRYPVSKTNTQKMLLISRLLRTHSETGVKKRVFKALNN